MERKESVKISVVCHGNVARSQILHHYLAEYANRASLSINPEARVSLPTIAFFALICEAAANPTLHDNSGVKNLLTNPRTPELPKSFFKVFSSQPKVLLKVNYLHSLKNWCMFVNK